VSIALPHNQLPPEPCMIELNVPGRGVIQTEYLVSDVNGTIALDGELIEGVTKALVRLSDRLEFHLLTADLVVPDIHAALELLEHPMRLVSSLRR
jgi:soluble P-type ATPase